MTAMRPRHQNSKTQNKKCHSAFGRGCGGQLHNPAEQSGTSQYCLQRSSVLLPQKYIKLRVQLESHPVEPLIKAFSHLKPHLPPGPTLHISWSGKLVSLSTTLYVKASIGILLFCICSHSNEATMTDKRGESICE